MANYIFKKQFGNRKAGSDANSLRTGAIAILLKKGIVVESKKSVEKQPVEKSEPVKRGRKKK